MAEQSWPPEFTLDQERILNLLTGDRFYTNPSAALREAILNAIDAVHRRRSSEEGLTPQIHVVFDRQRSVVTVSDNGIGMDQDDVAAFFTKVGASAAAAEQNKGAVGEFGIGVVSYFMAGDSFTLHTNAGQQAIGLRFGRSMLAGGGAEEVPPEQHIRGTTVEIDIRDSDTFELLLDRYPHWCRDVEGLSARLAPSDEPIEQGGFHRAGATINVDHPSWIERSHLGPIADPTGWNAMDGASTVAVLYRGVFVQEFEVRGIWGIEGSIDVDPKHFKPKLNREGFIEGQFQTEVQKFLRDCHPQILEAMAENLAAAFADGVLDKWTQQRWADLWLSVPRNDHYASVNQAWDAVFHSLPAFDLAVGNSWEPTSVEKLMKVEGDIYLAPLKDENPSDVTKAAVRYLRSADYTVVRGIRKERSWMRFAPAAYSTTADLIAAVFSGALPPLRFVAKEAESILQAIERVAPLFTGPPQVDLVRLGVDGPPALRLEKRLIINVDNSDGYALVEGALRENAGAASLIGLAARHAYDQLSQVAAVVRHISTEPEVLSPVRRRFIRSRLS